LNTPKIFPENNTSGNRKICINKLFRKIQENKKKYKIDFIVEGRVGTCFKGKN